MPDKQSVFEITIRKFRTMLLDNLRLFLTISEKGSLAAAAREAGLSSTTVSERLAALEMREAGFLPGRAEPADDSESSSALEAGFPLSDSQREIYFASQMGEEASCAYNESFTLKFRGDLKAEVLRDAVRRTVARHEALTLRFSESGPSGLSQRASEAPKMDIALENLSGLSQSERVDELARVYRHEATTPFDLENGPMIRFRLLQLEEDRFYLIGTSHHIVLEPVKHPFHASNRLPHKH